MTAVVCGVLGLVIGSFLNVVIHRVPLRKSVVWPSSHCPACGEPIAPRDNVPLISYAMLRGRCRNCGARIPARYPVVEGTTGLLFAAAGYEFGLGVQLVSALVLLSALVALAGIDLEHRLLPNVIVAPAALVGLALSVLVDPGGWYLYPLSALAVAGGLLALAMAYPGGMGMGDVKMGGMLGAFLGPYAALAVFLGAVIGAGAGGLLIATGKVGRRHHLPFGVFMSIGAVLALFLGPELRGLYLGLVGRG
ncbi:MAG TPA: prepilin peptidase [Rubrobacteraceae bacterium]|nr:prepilin peptidase [Rubrobacteraceae bacterium]